MLLGIMLLISAGLAFFVAAPLLSTEGAGAGTLPIDVTPMADLKRRRLVVYENLKDLEFEFQAGKMAREDYEALRKDYMGEAAQLMLASQDADQVSSDDELIERLVVARRARRTLASTPEYVCPKCGFENPLPVKFCGECGARIGPRARK